MKQKILEEAIHVGCGTVSSAEMEAHSAHERTGGFANMLDGERVAEILRAYVFHDAQAADTDYIREVLHDVCGCTSSELTRLGFSAFEMPDKQ